MEIQKVLHNLFYDKSYNHIKLFHINQILLHLIKVWLNLLIFPFNLLAYKYLNHHPKELDLYVA